jgi:hypothetical protein
MSLPTTTHDRLHAVADVIRSRPELWDQTMWDAEDETCDTTVDLLNCRVGVGAECLTPACVAGWAVRFLPPGSGVLYSRWSSVGREALGLSRDLAGRLFDDELAELDHDHMADLLDALADLPEPRTLEDAECKLPLHLYALLLVGDDCAPFEDDE